MFLSPCHSPEPFLLLDHRWEWIQAEWRKNSSYLMQNQRTLDSLKNMSVSWSWSFVRPAAETSSMDSKSAPKLRSENMSQAVGIRPRKRENRNWSIVKWFRHSCQRLHGTTTLSALSKERTTGARSILSSMDVSMVSIASAPMSTTQGSLFISR